MSSIPLLDPQLRHCRRLFLKDFRVSMHIGVHDYEKKGPQPVLVSVDLYVPLNDNTPNRDQLTEVLDYNFMRDNVIKITTAGHIHLLETVCDQIATTMLAHPLVLATRVSAEKPTVYNDCAGVGVEVFRFKTAEH